MKIWGDRHRGNPVRVAIFLEEKGVDIPFEPVDLLKGEHKTAEFLAKNPSALVPVLELDDGTCIAETMAICRYLERQHPDPPLMGRSPLEEAVIEMWQRRVELEFYAATRAVFRHSVPALQVLEPVQIAEWAELNRPRVLSAMEMFEPQLAHHRFLAGDEFTVADITAVMPLQMIKALGIEVPEDCPSVARWRKKIFARPCVISVLHPSQP
jgi:glutathione S-transferase